MEALEGIMCPLAVNALVVIGGLFLAKTALSVLGSLYATFLRPGKNLGKYGAWAVVTGATGEQLCCLIVAVTCAMLQNLVCVCVYPTF